MKDAPHLLLLLSTAPSMDVARRLAQGLVGEGLCACINVLPGVKSIYRWKGKVEVEDEVQLLMKTRPERLDEVAAWFDEHHPYDVPEFVVLSAQASQAYGAFVEEQCSPDA